MFCPECRAEFQRGITHCALCDVDLVDADPGQDLFSTPERMAEHLANEEVVGLVVGNHTSVEEAQRVLASARIASIVVADRADEVETAMHTRFYLMVASQDMDAARKVFVDRWQAGLEREGLELTSHADVDGVEVCPACGASVAMDAEECPECGLFVGAAEA